MLLPPPPQVLANVAQPGAANDVQFTRQAILFALLFSEDVGCITDPVLLCVEVAMRFEELAGKDKHGVLRPIHCAPRTRLIPGRVPVNDFLHAELLASCIALVPPMQSAL